VGSSKSSLSAPNHRQVDPSERLPWPRRNSFAPSPT
jgi:hypothetical protein